MPTPDRQLLARPATALAVAVCALAVVVGMSLVVADPAGAQAPSEVAEPVLVVGGAATDGQVSLSPATQPVTEARVAWLLTNGGADGLVFDLAVHDVVTSAGDVQVGTERRDLPLALDRLHLEPGEAARIPLQLPDTATPGTVALVARSVDAEPETTVSGVALLGADGEVDPRISASDAGAGTFTVRLDADAPALVDVAVRSRAWPGILQAEDVVEGVLVPAGGRDLDIALGGAVAGRLHVEVAVTGGAHTAAAVWWWPAEAVLALVAVAAVLVGAVVWLLRRRRRARPSVA